jgi:hypothetical protein
VSTTEVRWALSPLDFLAHALTDGQQPPDVLVSRCGQRLPRVIEEHADPPGAICLPCGLAVGGQLLDPGRMGYAF